MEIASPNKLKANEKSFLPNTSHFIKQAYKLIYFVYQIDT
jgi:hypothetical protein